MSVAELESAEITLEASQGGLWSEAFRRLRRNPSAIIGFVLVSLFILVAIFAPLLAPDDPRAQDLQRDLQRLLSRARRRIICSASTTSAATSCRASSTARGCRC